MKEGDKLRVGLMGVGAIAQVVHLPVLARLENVDLVAVCDVDQPRAQAIAARFGIPRVYTDDDDVFAADDIDAIIICSPSHLHESQAIAGLQGGKHVLVEKPLALTAEAAQRVIEVAEKTDRTLMIAMNNRWRPDTMALRPFARHGELGDIFLTRGAWLNRKTRVVRPTWRHRKVTAGGGALMDLGVQTLDLCLWMQDYPEAVSVTTHLHFPEGMEVEDSAGILVRLANGSAVSLTVSWSLVAERDRHYMRLLGTRGSGAIAPLGVYKELETGQIIDVTPQVTQGRENLYTASYRQELSHFVGVALGQGEEALPREQVQIMKIVEAGYRSFEEKREVEIG
ncbi:MAG TPA: Gfo/Idh/MocA family oxidoreductase [Longimicrobiales bacterium]|nr:Gfo/Idh/MocA family oxidoreductase [Longimicrobiales bacterium]